MSLRLPPPDMDPSAPPAEGESGAPLASPFADGPGGFLSSADLETKPNKFSSASVLFLVLAIAAGLLFGMRKMGMGPKLSLAEIKIDYPIDNAVSVINKDHDRVLADLRSGGRIRRVPLDMVQINPFAWRGLKAKETPQGAVVDEAELSRKEAELHRLSVAKAASALVLNSILGGKTPIARISGELARVGDRVGEHFIVTAIDGRSVTLTAGADTFTLTLGEEQPPAPGPGGKNNPFGTAPRR